MKRYIELPVTRRDMLRSMLAVGALTVPLAAHPAVVVVAPGLQGNNVVAASASRANVQAAVNTAVDGDTVLIPNGSSTWTSGISTTKQIIIRAQNYTPTPAGTAGSGFVANTLAARTGASSRNVTITNNSSTALFSFTSGDDHHCGLGGIAFEEGTGDGEHLVLNGAGSKPPLIFDNAFESKARFFPANPFMRVACLGGVMWNCYIEGTFSIAEAGSASLLIKNEGGVRNWETNGTIGTDDTGGSVNFYMEDCTAINVGQFPDIDDHGRFVARNCVFDGTWGLTHGFTSTWGGRHWEYYDNVFQQRTTGRNLAGRYFWCRAGTGVFTDNEAYTPADTSSYGNVSQLDIGDNTSPGTYLQDRQPGCGYESSAYASDPIYMWNESGARAYTWGTSNGWGSIVQQNRDIFVNNGARPSYTKYTYPHPLRI